MTTPQFQSKLRQLHCSGMLDALPGRLAQAQGAGLSHLEFLELLVQDELAVRADRAVARRVRQAGIVEQKELADFDWSFNPKLPRGRLCELATGRFVAQKTNVLLMGPPGVGKSHLAVAIALGAIRAGYHVRVKNIFVLADELLEAEATSCRREVIEKLSAVDLLILEDFAMKTLKSTAAEDLLDILMRRHEQRATMITSNRPTEDWGKFLGDIPATTAILDRFLQHVDVLLMDGRSYRLDHRVHPHAAEAGGIPGTAPAVTPPPSAPSPPPRSPGRRRAATPAHQLPASAPEPCAPAQTA